MVWNQVTDPLGNVVLSALVALLPIAFIFWALIIKKMRGHWAALYTALIAVVLAVTVYRMPVDLAMLSALHGAFYGLFPICWIIVTAVYLFNLTVKSGQFEVIKHFMTSITSDRRLQALLIAFSFGAFLEGTSGFGTPVAITAAMLVGLGSRPLYAAGICLIANTAPVAFGGVGIPVTVAAQVSGLPEMAISQIVGRTLPILSVLLPFYLVTIMSGYRKAVEVWPAIFVSGFSFGLFQWLSSNYLGPMLPDVISGTASIVCLVVFLRFWKPKTLWRFHDEPIPETGRSIRYTNGQVLRAWSPFILLTIMIMSWGLNPVKTTLDSLGLISIEIPGLHQLIRQEDGTLISQVFKFNYLSATGTTILIASFISVPLVGLRWSDGFRIFLFTIRQLRFAILTISVILGFAFIVNDSGITITIASALAGTGALYPFFAPVLGWLGVFITGSDTSSNALFGKLQFATGQSIGVDPVVTVGANLTGGVVGKMISPQSIAVAAAAGNLVGKESQLFRFTVKHSFIMLAFICVLTVLQAYILTWMIPSYTMAGDAVGAQDVGTQLGFYCLMTLTVVVTVFISLVYITNRNKEQ